MIDDWSCQHMWKINQTGVAIVGNNLLLFNNMWHAYLLNDFPQVPKNMWALNTPNLFYSKCLVPSKKHNISIPGQVYSDRTRVSGDFSFHIFWLLELLSPETLQTMLNISCKKDAKFPHHQEKINSGFWSGPPDLILGHPRPKPAYLLILSIS